MRCSREDTSHEWRHHSLPQLHNRLPSGDMSNFARLHASRMREPYSAETGGADASSAHTARTTPQTGTLHHLPCYYRLHPAPSSALPRQQTSSTQHTATGTHNSVQAKGFGLKERALLAPATTVAGRPDLVFDEDPHGASARRQSQARGNGGENNHRLLCRVQLLHRPCSLAVVRRGRGRGLLSVGVIAVACPCRSRRRWGARAIVGITVVRFSRPGIVLRVCLLVSGLVARGYASSTGRGRRVLHVVGVGHCGGKKGISRRRRHYWDGGYLDTSCGGERRWAPLPSQHCAMLEADIDRSTRAEC